jgi:hypothetical protein
MNIDGCFGENLMSYQQASGRLMRVIHINKKKSAKFVENKARG